MFKYIDIPYPRDRRRVKAAELALLLATAPFRLIPSPHSPFPTPHRILLLRLERMGDFLMSLGAIEAIARLAPDAEIDLVVGSWNRELARLLPHVTRMETLDAPWLARHAPSSAPGTGARGAEGHLLRTAWSWRTRGYDLGINFEPDIRSNILLGLARCRRRVGFDMAGGAPVLTDRVTFDPGRHVAMNGLALVERAFDRRPGTLTPGWRHSAPLAIPESARARAAAILDHSDKRSGPDTPRAWLIGVHVSGGREIKQWDVERFAELTARLSSLRRIFFVFTGSSGDRPLVDRVLSRLTPDVRWLDLAGDLDLATLAAVLDELDLFITADTGPMHLAATVGTPLVALFGPSDPNRWGPLSSRAAIVRHELPCSPCNRIRQPPQRCVGGVPQCLAAIEVDDVYRAAVSLLNLQDV